MCLGIAAGAGWLTGQGGGSARVTAALGVALVAYALLGLFKVKLQVNPRHERWLSPLVGLATGLVTAASGVFVIPAVPYLNALGLAKEDLVRALGISFLVSTIALAVSLRSGGALELGNAVGSLLALLPALARHGAGPVGEAARATRAVQEDLLQRLAGARQLPCSTLRAVTSPEPRFAKIAAMIGDPTRARMLAR